MGIIATIIIGLLVGIVAKFLMPGKDPGGFIVTTIIGIVGATVGAFLGQKLGFYQVGEPAGFIVSVLGAMLLLGIYRLLIGKKG